MSQNALAAHLNHGDACGPCDLLKSSINKGESTPFTDSDELTVFPNPSDGIVTISFKSIKKNVQVDVLDVSGKVIQTENFANGNNFSLELEVNEGIYFLRLRYEGQQKMIKVVVQ